MSYDTYNGWTNYETWVVKLWMDNDEGSYGYVSETAQSCFDDADGDTIDERKDEAINALAARLEEMHNEMMPEVVGVFSDLLGRAMGRVNWGEIACAIIGDLDIETEEAA